MKIHLLNKCANANDQVLKALRPCPDRAFGFVYLNPNHLDFSLNEFARCVRDGPMVGVKLWIAKRCNASELDPIVERATSMQAPILQHTWLKVGGNNPGESSPFDFVELAKRHPRREVDMWPHGRGLGKRNSHCAFYTEYFH